MPASDPSYRVRPDGAFEIDHYRQQAIAMRRHAMRCDRKAPAFIKLLVLAALLMIVGVVVAPRAPMGDRAVAVATGSERPPAF